MFVMTHTYQPLSCTLSLLATALVAALTATPIRADQQQPPDVSFEKLTARFTGDLDEMVKRRFIRVAVTYSKTHYFIDKGVQRGASYEGVKLFEDDLNTKLKTGNLRVHFLFVPMSRDELLTAVAEGRADMAVAALTVTPERQKLVDFANPTMRGVSNVVVTSADGPKISTAEDLSGQSVVLRPSSAYAAEVAELNARLRAKGMKEVVVKAAPETFEDEDILEMVNAGLVKATVVHSHLAAFWKQMFPNLQIHDTAVLAKDQDLAPATRKNSPKLMAEINEWGKTHGPKTMFGNLLLKRYLQSTQFAKGATNESEMRRFRSMIDLFHKYGEQYELDYLLMAAQGYQESGLDQNAKSQVGAVGVMQVMPKTGAELKVGDIRQVDPNIHAGVKYIRFMIDQYFAKEPMDDRNKMLFAFAAYNAGPARVRQLRKAAAARKLDPNKWFDNVERIASERIGRETVQYVANIYKYYVAYRLSLEEVSERKSQGGHVGLVR